MSSSENNSQEEDAGSSMSVGSRGLPPLPNHDHYNLIRQRLDRYRRGSEGNFRTPTEIILRRIPQPRLPSNSTLTGQQQHRMDRGSNTSQFRQRGGLNCAADPRNRSISPNEGGGGITGRPRSQSLDAEDTPLSVSHMYNPDEIDSGSSTPTSSASRRSSVSSCSELISALESVMADLQDTMNADSAIAEEMEPVSTETSNKGGSVSSDQVTACKREASLEKAPSQDLGKAWKIDLAEKEKLLNECKNQIRTLSSSKQQLERACDKQREQLEYSMSFKIPSKCPLKRWPTIVKGNVYDILHPLNLDDVYSEPREIINALLESERRYISGLSLLHTQFEEPLKMLALYKPDVLSLHQLNCLFLNCSELLLLHRSFYEDLCVLPSMASQTAQVDRLLEICERVFPSFSIYSPFMDTSRRQNVQKEMRQLGQKPQFTEVLVHCQNTCKETKFMDLLMLPTERLNKYSDLLTYFLDPRVRALPEDGTKRAETIIRFLRNLRYEMFDEKSEVDHMQEKVKLLQKLAPDTPTPLEIFDSDVHLVKQGPLTQVVGKKETQRMCFLFNRYIAVAESATQTQYRILEHGMIPLSGAQLHKSVDIEGQALQPDLKSGRQEDRLAFRLSFVSNESLYFRVARPNELKGWVERLEKSIQESQQAHEQPEAEEFCPYPADIGPKIAAASLEKLFQQLTSPQIFREDFTEVFLLTHSCFTTPKDVLTALVNCVKSYEDSMSDTSSQTSGSFAFPFSMDELSPCVSASPSSYNLHVDSEAGSPTPGSTPCSAPWVGRASPASPTPSPSNPLPRNGNLDPAERKAVLSGASFVSSGTDSDTSPHTSAVVDGNTLAAGMNTNGWGIESKGLESNDADNDPYSRLIPRERVHVGSVESDGEEAVDGDETPRNQSLSGPTTPGRGDTSLHLETEDNNSGGGAGHSRIKHSESVMQQLDESSHMLDMLTESLNVDLKSNPATPSRGSANRPHLSHSISKESSVFNEVEEQEHMARYQAASGGEVKRRSRTLSENASRLQVVSTLSTSEPDLVNIEIDDDDDGDTPPPLPPRTPDMIIESAAAASREARSLSGSAVGNRMIRGSSEHSLLTASLNIGPGHRSPYLQSNSALAISPAHQQSRSALSTPERRKHSTFDNSGSRTPKKQLSAKKSSTLGRQSPVPPGEQKKSSKSRWNFVKKKVSRTFKKSPSMEGGNLQGSPRESRSQSIPTIRRNNVTRKTSVGPEVKLSVAMDVPDGGVGGASSQGPSPARRQRTLSTQGGGVTLIAKIFSVLGCWQENYFEDFGSDDELRQMLEDFLQNFVDKSPTDSQEYSGALHLLESMSDKRMRMESKSSTAPSFPQLLQRVTKIEPDVLKMYDWEHPDKLMAGKQIDLGKSHPKDTMFHKVMAEQLTLMEFAVYSAVQRRELLKCAWKKPDKETQAPNLCRLIRRTNEMTSWVSTEILSHETPQQRARVIENFVQIAHHCYNHNDFHCALNITIALGSACIKSLRHTWEEVEKKSKSRLEKLKNQVDYHGRCKKMREKLEKITEESMQRANKLPNALPYIGAYLDQVYALEMNSKTYNPDGLVNFAKMTKLAQMIQNVLQYQKSRFGFEPRLDVMAYVTAAKRLSENDLYELSTKREPHCH